jgi:hypothetical protein
VVRPQRVGDAGFLGLLTSIWAEKFDHAASVTNFVVQPLSLLSGTFYAVDQLSPTFYAISHATRSSTSYPAFATVSSASRTRRLPSARCCCWDQHRTWRDQLRSSAQRLEAQALTSTERRLSHSFSMTSSPGA